MRCLTARSWLLEEFLLQRAKQTAPVGEAAVGAEVVRKSRGFSWSRKTGEPIHDTPAAAPAPASTNPAPASTSV